MNHRVPGRSIAMRLLALVALPIVLISTKKDAGAFYNLKLALQDTDGRNVGILVMEIPFTSVADEAAAIRQAESIRRELALKIPSHKALFQ